MNRNPAGFPARPGSSPLFVCVCTLLIMLAVIGAVSPTVFLTLLKHGPIAVGMIFSATGLGLGLVDLLQLGRIEPRWRIMAAAALGIGALALLMLGLGSLSLLHRPTWILLLAAFLGLGIWRMWAMPFQPAAADQPSTSGSLRYLWLVAGLFAALALLAATIPPGILWPREGNGYDVLEYHLAAPREYFEAGRIGYLPHNLYSNLPFNVEMLYLLAMVLHGDALQAALTAQLLHCFLGGLAVAAIWLAGREMGRSVGIFSGIMAAVCPFVVYLGALAYVECELLFFSAMALAAMIRSTRADGQAATRWMIVSGLCAGFACGCKYTGIPATLIPLAIAALWSSTGRRRRAPSHAAAFLFSSIAALSPWLIKNIAYTGNPFFPLARSVFPERAGLWDDDGAARWREGHMPAPADRPLPARIRRAWSEIIGSHLFGPIMGLAIIAEAARRLLRRRVPPIHKKDEPGAVAGMTTCYLMAVVGLTAWLFFTHLVDRFAVVLLIPACVLFSRAADELRSKLRGWVFPLVVAATAVLNLKTLLETYADAHVFQILAVRDDENRVNWMTGGQWARTAHVPRLNALTNGGHKVLMIADAKRYYLNPGVDYCVVFNRNPFADASANLTPGELIVWLQQKGYTHVYVDWGEMSRLRHSRYGFWKSVDVELFRRLESEGLRPIEHFRIKDDRPPYATLYEVTAPARH